MKERPILFNAPMVRALLAGTKTQTRRVVKAVIGPHTIEQMLNKPASAESFIRHLCPYGQPGDRLWVREAWAMPHKCDHLKISTISMIDGGRSIKDHLHYAATEVRGRLLWRPSIHMPRWASRITLEITDVRVERLQDISEADCRAEGCGGGHLSIPDCPYSATPREHYRYLWGSINDPGSWDENPWVWVVEFRKTLNAKLSGLGRADER